jgi:hypothetical protein
LLKGMSEQVWQLIADVMRHHPWLTLAETVEALRLFGGL